MLDNISFKPWKMALVLLVFIEKSDICHFSSSFWLAYPHFYERRRLPSACQSFWCIICPPSPKGTHFCKKQTVTHPNTDQSQRCLTSVIGLNSKDPPPRRPLPPTVRSASLHDKRGKGLIGETYLLEQVFQILQSSKGLTSETLTFLPWDQWIRDGDLGVFYKRYQRPD